MNSFGIAVILLTLSAVAATATPSCDDRAGWASDAVSGKVHHPDRGAFDVGVGIFALDPFEFGWRIRMLGRDGRDIPVFAAPRRPEETNPLNIAGWHFRNAVNTGPNTGDVNAPQRERRFAFGTIATDPAINPDLAATTRPQDGVGGLGVLTINEYILTPPRKGARATMRTLSFSVCLLWQGGADRLNPIVNPDPAAAFEDVIAAMRGCGLDTHLFKPSDHMAAARNPAQPPFLGPDMDGDGIPDLVVPVIRRHDQAPGLAICLIGDETLIMAGYRGRIGRHLDPAYFNSADGWAIHKGPIYQSADESPPPVLSGDAIVMGKDDSSSVIVFLKPDLTVSSYWQGD